MYFRTSADGTFCELCMRSWFDRPGGTRVRHTYVDNSRVWLATPEDWVSPMSDDSGQQHADYPHVPGSLFDCLACESRCYCQPNETQCVHCAIDAERRTVSERTQKYIDRFNF